MVVFVLLVSACGRKLPPPILLQLGPGVELGALPDEAANFGGEPFTFTATMTSGSGVTSWSWNFGGGATPDTATGSGNSSSVPVILTPNDAAQTYNGSFTAADANGTTTKTFEYSVGPTQNMAPTLSLAYAAGVITATGADADGDDLTFTFTVTSGDVMINPASVGPTSTYVQEATLSAAAFGDFAFTVEVTVDDGVGGTATETISDTYSVPPPGHNVIWMTVDRSTVAVGEDVLMTVWAVDLEDPLMYLDSAMIEYDGFGVGAATLTNDTFNLGGPGGEEAEPDGFWELIPGGYSLVAGGIPLFGPYDAAYFVGGTAVPAGRKYIAVNVAPTFIGVTPTAAPAGSTGPIFNILFTAETAGTHEFHFVHEYSQSAAGAIIAGTLYRSDETNKRTFDDSQSLDIIVE